MGIWTEVERVDLRVTYSVPVLPTDLATLHVSVTTTFMISDPPICTFEVQLCSVDTVTTPTPYSRTFPVVTVGRYGSPHKEAFDWPLPVAALNEDLFAVLFVNNAGTLFPRITSGCDEIKVRARKCGDKMTASGWCESKTVYAHFGPYDIPSN